MRAVILFGNQIEAHQFLRMGPLKYITKEVSNSKGNTVLQRHLKYLRIKYVHITKFAIMYYINTKNRPDLHLLSFREALNLKKQMKVMIFTHNTEKD